MLQMAVGRRTVLKRVVAFVGGIAAVFGVGYVGSRPSAAVEADDRFLADDVRVERNDGELDAVTVAPELALSWADFGGGVDTVDVTVTAALDGESGFDVLFDGPVEGGAVAVDGDGFDAADGSVTLGFDRLDLTATGSAVTLGDFGGDLAPGSSKTTGVDLMLRVDVAGEQAETVTTVETTQFDVTVHNPEGETSTTGRAHTNAE